MKQKKSWTFGKFTNLHKMQYIINNFLFSVWDFYQKNQLAYKSTGKCVMKQKKNYKFCYSTNLQK